MTDKETADAIEALTHRLRIRDRAIRDGEDYPDAELFAGEYLTALRGHGWRPTEAKVYPAWRPASVPAADPRSEDTRALLRQALEAAEAATAARHAAADAQDAAEGSAA